MSCKICNKSLGKKSKAIIENLCDKCYSKKGFCGFDGCMKKIFSSGYCSIHIATVNKKTQQDIKHTVTEKDLERREKMREYFDQRERNNEARRMNIEEYKNTIPNDPFTREFYKGLFDEMEEQYINDEKAEFERIDKELSDLREHYRNIFENKGADYTNKKNKFKFYMEEEFDHYKYRKKTKQAAKEERTKSRGKCKKETKQEPEFESDDSEESECQREFDITFLEAFIVLEMEKTIDIELVKKAYRKAALKYHPDRNIGDIYATEKFQEVGSAYEFLMKYL